MISQRILAALLTLPAFMAIGGICVRAAQQPATKPQASATVRPVVTLTGCLYREDQVPGRKPNIAERAGILEDYILADAAISGDSKAAAAGATGTSGAVPAEGNMYKVEKISDSRLKALLGKRVEVKGKIDPEGKFSKTTDSPGTPRPDRGPGPDKINLPEFEAESIRALSGTCPAVPAQRK